MRRRTFLKTAVGAALGLSRVGHADIGTYPYPSLREAFVAAGFDPTAPESFTSIWTADTHYGIGESATILPAALDEVLTMSAPPAFWAIAGDLICKASLSFGQIPDEKQQAEALDEFRAIKAHIDRIEAHIPVKLALGNHDTHPGEDSPDLFHAVFPDRPEFHAFETGGVPFIFLNGGSSGYLDSDQRHWFREQVTHRFDPEASFITVCHQPSLGRVTNERGVTQAYRHALPDINGDLWMVSGHHHRNSDRCFALPSGTITQATITTPNPTVWGTEKPGYWVYGFHNRHLAVRVFRRLGEGFALAPPPPREAPEPLRLPFEDTPTLWKVLVGEGDEPYRVETDARWCQNYWYYNKRLVYRLPMHEHRDTAKRLAILASAESDTAPQFAISPDGETWTASDGPSQTGDMVQLDIPPACAQTGTVYARMESCSVSGLALLA